MLQVTKKSQITKAAITEHGHLCTYSVKSSGRKTLVMLAKKGYKVVYMEGAKITGTIGVPTLPELKLKLTVNHW